MKGIIVRTRKHANAKTRMENIQSYVGGVRWLSALAVGIQSLNLTRVASTLSSFGYPVNGQVQGFSAGHTPVVCLLANLVIPQSCLVVHREPLHRVCGQGLWREGDRVVLCVQSIPPKRKKGHFSFPH